MFYENQAAQFNNFWINFDFSYEIWLRKYLLPQCRPSKLSHSPRAKYYAIVINLIKKKDHVLMDIITWPWEFKAVCMVQLPLEESYHLWPVPAVSQTPESHQLVLRQMPFTTVTKAAWISWSHSIKHNFINSTPFKFLSTGTILGNRPEIQFSLSPTPTTTSLSPGKYIFTQRQSWPRIMCVFCTKDMFSARRTTFLRSKNIPCKLIAPALPALSQ